MMEFLRMKATLILMALLVAGVRADDLDDYVAAAYNGKGDFVRSGNTYIGSHDIIVKSGNAYISSRGTAVRSGNVFITEENKTVVKSGNAFIGDNDIIIKSGDTYNGNSGTTVKAGNYMYKP